MDTVSSTASDAPRAQSTVEHLSFTGSGGEYFRIWIVNLLLSILTLGIYSAWAKVRRLRYFYGNTQLAGSSFEYHGEPIKILKGRLIALALIIPYSLASQFSPGLAIIFLLLFLIALPFIIVKSRLFQTRMSSWRNIHFDFTGTYRQAAWVYLGLSVLIIFTLGLITPYLMYRRQKFLLGQTRYGATDVEFGATPGQYYKAYIVAIGIVMAGFLLGGIVMSLFGGRPSLDGMGRSLFGSFLFALVLGGAYFIAFAYIQASITNAAYGELTIGQHELKCDLNAVPLAGLYFTNALLMALTLGLYTPWAKVRLVRYQIENMRLLTRGSLDEFVAGQAAGITATGSEIGDLLDLDFGL